MMLGNLSVKEIENELGINFPEPFRSELQDLRQENAENIMYGRWHCFRFPLEIVCGGKKMQNWIVDNLMPYSDHMNNEIKVVSNIKEY